MPDQTPINVNLLYPESAPPKKKWRYLLYGLIIAAVLGLATGSVLLVSGQNQPLEEGEQKPGFFTQLKNLILSSDRKLKGEKEDRVNILLLGMGGQGHDGAYLTDTIILASVKPASRQLALLSIPRDLLAEIPGYGFRRINEANSFGEVQTPGTGSQLTKTVVEKVLDLPIHYYLRIDFEGFKQMIDKAGGIDVYVDRAFTDPKFPAAKYKYRTVSFNQGWQKMDGQTALDFARSRHGSNNEDSDFARSRRQQKVIRALKDKVFSFSTFFNLGRLQNLFDDFSAHIQTNVELWEVSRFYKLAKALDYENMISRVLGSGENEPLIETQYGGAFVLQPRTGDFEEIRRLALNLFILPTPTAKAGAPALAPPLPQSRIQILNGTWILGLAAEAKVNLEQKGLAIENVGNTKIRNYEKTVIYDYSHGRFPEVLNQLQTELSATVHANPPDGLLDSPPPDILVILGKDNRTQ